MANLLRIEPTKSSFTGEPDGFGWFIFDDGRQYHRRLDVKPRKEVNFPMIKRDSIDPVQSQADGKIYDSISALYRSYSDNPQGVKYECIGDDTSICTDFKPPERDDAKAAQAIERAMQEFGL